MTTKVTFTINGATEEDERRFAKAIDDAAEDQFTEHLNVAYHVMHDGPTGGSGRAVKHDPQ